MISEGTTDLFKKSMELTFNKNTALDVKVEELQRKNMKLVSENNELNTALMNAGRDKMMAMARLNEEMESMRTYVRNIKKPKSKLKRDKLYNSRKGPRKYSSPKNSSITKVWN